MKGKTFKVVVEHVGNLVDTGLRFNGGRSGAFAVVGCAAENTGEAGQLSTFLTPIPNMNSAPGPSLLCPFCGADEAPVESFARFLLRKGINEDRELIMIGVAELFAGLVTDAA